MKIHAEVNEMKEKTRLLFVMFTLLLSLVSFHETAFLYSPPSLQFQPRVVLSTSFVSRQE